MNTQAIRNHTIGGAPSTARVLGAYVEEIRCEALRLIRNPGLVFPVLIMPLGLYALFAMVITPGAIDKDPHLGTFLFAAFSVMAISMPAVFGMSTSLAMEREMGMLRLKRAQPAPAGSWLVAKVACGLGFGLIAYLPILALALGTGKLQLAAGPAVNMSLTLLACAIPFCALGLMIGALVKGSAAAGYANLVYLPGCYLSGLFFPLPKSMDWQAPIWPQYHVIQLAKHSAGIAQPQDEPMFLALAILLAFTGLFSYVAIWRLKHKG